LHGIQGGGLAGDRVRLGSHHTDEPHQRLQLFSRSAKSCSASQYATTAASPPSPKPGYALLDATVLLALLGTCAGVYCTVGNTGFSAIIGAAAGLYGTWRARR
jgi:hypothetical protein